MANIKVWLEQAVEKYGEPLEAIVVGKHDRAEWSSDPNEDENVVLSPEVGLSKVDEDYDNGYGGADCYPITAWTKSRVFFISEYDGSTCMTWVYRNPTDHAPGFSGTG